MNRKAGLQKKVSSIFDGVEVPSKSVRSALAGSSDPGAGVDADSSERVMPGKTPSGSGATDAVGNEAALSSAAASESVKFFKSVSSGDLQRNRKMLVIAAVLMVFLVGVIVRSYVFGPAEKNSVSKSTASAKEIAGSISGGDVVEWSVPEQVGENIRDITVSGGRTVSSASAGGFVVRGILLSEDRNSAIVGKNIVHIGDQIAGATVVSISRKTVEFERDGKRWMQQVEK